MMPMIAANCIWICEEEGKACISSKKREQTATDQWECEVYGCKACHDCSCRCCQGRGM